MLEFNIDKKAPSRASVEAAKDDVVRTFHQDLSATVKYTSLSVPLLIIVTAWYVLNAEQPNKIAVWAAIIFLYHQCEQTAQQTQNIDLTNFV